MQLQLNTAVAGEGLFWFATAGAAAAALKHLFTPTSVFKELTPVALREGGEKDKQEASPEALWWGGYAFSAMNVGTASFALFGAYKQNQAIKQAYLFGVGVMFECFALAWWTRGSITGNKNHKKQSGKIAAFGALFLYGCAITPA
eukprot:comp20697_c0_seq1/m.26972 comp20697_c0_seq1/g.26972  ORF comp20697_c0_seq1/g.26972 comp20697_c0_seq1/m.26972 type:complete len:145 (-) comp20697_c0_seq1:413-847(-)